MSTTSDKTVTFPVIKYGMTVRLSDADLFEQQAARFPRKGHWYEVPLTDETRAVYAAMKIRWEAARHEWDAVVEEATKRGWGRGVGGYEWEDAEFYELEPRREWISDETDNEWHTRVQSILDHHKATGEWLEEPQKSLMELMTDEIHRSFARSTSHIANALVVRPPDQN